MKRVKVLLLAVLVLFSVIMVFSFLIPSRSMVSRTINIPAARDSIMKTLVNLENWGQWHPQLKGDSAARLITFGPVRSGKGALLSYNNFTMSFTGVTDSSIQIMMTNSKGDQLASELAVYSLGDSCAVNWSAAFDVKWYPWEKFRSIFFDNMYGPSLEANLKALKASVQRK